MPTEDPNDERLARILKKVRRIELLKGEVLITTAKDSALRPFIVQTRHGTARALGTRFSVRVGE
jgi:transmembrane sensor